MREIYNGMKLKLKKDLILRGIFTLSKVKKGEVGEVIGIKDKQIKIKFSSPCYGVGIFDTKEVDIYFEPTSMLYEYDDIKKYIVNNNVVVVILNSGSKGIARCLEGDIFNEQVGIRIAYLKAKKKEIEKELKTY